MNRSPSDRLLGIVLCGGRSSRMGREKSLLPHPDGGTMWNHSVERLVPFCQEVCLAGSLSDETSLRVLRDPISHAGPATGIASGLAIARQQSWAGVFANPVDMPALTGQDLLRICQVWRSDSGKLVCGVCESDDRLQPLVAIYPTHLLKAIQELTQSEDRSLHRWIARQVHVRVPLSQASCWNINSPEDLDRGP